MALNAQRQGFEQDDKMETEITNLLTLVDLVEKSLNCIETSTMSLENFQNSFETLCDLFKSLEAKIDKLDLSKKFSSNKNEEMFVYAKVFLQKMFYYLLN